MAALATAIPASRVYEIILASRPATSRMATGFPMVRYSIAAMTMAPPKRNPKASHGTLKPKTSRPPAGVHEKKLFHTNPATRFQRTRTMMVMKRPRRTRSHETFDMACRRSCRTSLKNPMMKPSPRCRKPATMDRMRRSTISVSLLTTPLRGIDTPRSCSQLTSFGAPGS